MNGPTVARRATALLLAVLLLTLSSTMAWAAVNDFDARGRIPNGVSVAGVDLSGMQEARARDAILRAVSAPLMRPVTVRAGAQTFAFDPRRAVDIDVNSMLDEAYAARRSASYLTRMYSDITRAPLERNVTPTFAVDEAVLDEWVSGVAREVNLRAQDASLTVADGRVFIRASKTGRRLDREQTSALLRGAFATEQVLTDVDRIVSAPVKTLQPKVTEKDFKKTIVVDISERRVKLFDGIKVEKTYRCAVGTPGYPTPKGNFEIVQKRYMPTWVNPAPNGWGAGMPRSIAPGPSNPLGTRAMNLSAPGIRFHGTTNTGSIGTAASHGCMRMHRRDIEDFYERVDVGTKVFIIP